MYAYGGGVMFTDKTVYLLGAGASIGHSKSRYPNIMNFFIKAKEFEFFKGQFFDKLLEYVFDTYGIEPRWKKALINIEELLTLIIIDEEYNRDIWNENLSKLAIRFIQNCINHLDQSLDLEKSEYDFFSEIIRPKDTIITFNWDLLLDNVFGRKSHLIINDNWEKNQYGNFILHLSGLGESTYTHVSIEKPYAINTFNGDIGYYIKLHGSIDWKVCINESCRAYGRIFPLLDYQNLSNCAECHEHVDDLLIPPVLNKQYRKYPSIRKLWATALHEIAFADKLVIWGYSLPPTDFYTNWLLRHTDQLKEVIIINPECIKGKNDKKWNREFVKKFKNIFSVHGDDVKIKYYEFFMDYYTKKSINDKYGLKDL